LVLGCDPLHPHLESPLLTLMSGQVTQIEKKLHRLAWDFWISASTSCQASSPRRANASSSAIRLALACAARSRRLASRRASAAAQSLLTVRRFAVPGRAAPRNAPNRRVKASERCGSPWTHRNRNASLFRVYERFWKTERQLAAAPKTPSAVAESDGP